MGSRRVYAKLGRAGLGNELFPYLRAVDLSRANDLPLIQPRWIQPRVGPWLRGERDPRAYWRIFNPPSLGLFVRQLYLEVLDSLSRRFSSFRSFQTSTLIVAGMENHFSSLNNAGPWYRKYLAAQVRSGQISENSLGNFLSVHVRLGDFGRPSEGTKVLTQNNMGTPIAWYEEVLNYVKNYHPSLPILLASDGSDEELSSLLSIPGVARTSPLNAIDELFIMSRAVGIVGSRSTFSSWGAFLGHVPLLVISGGNAYPPHDEVWEDIDIESRQSWLRALGRRLQSDALDRQGF